MKPWPRIRTTVWAGAAAAEAVVVVVAEGGEEEDWLVVGVEVEGEVMDVMEVER